MKLVAVALLAASAASAFLGLRHLNAGVGEVRGNVRRHDCRDGAPARILVDSHCVDGICGVTCAPDRWLVR